MTQGDAAWRCAVCGYVHRGAEPPEVCPVCGASRDDFEPYVEQMPASKKPANWRCVICNYLHAGAGPPAVCPVCGARADEFETLEARAEAAVAGERAPKVVILGSGIAGVSAAEALRAASPEADIVVISKEPALPYYRLNLTRYLAGEVDASALPIHPESWYAEHRIDLIPGAEAVSFSIEDNWVELSTGQRETFEKLIITAGSHPFMPPIAGAYKEGVMTLRTRGDADAILDAAKAAGRCVCIGGGLLGLETAAALARHGVHVTVLEGFGWLLPRQLTPEAGALLERHVAGLGIDVRTGVKVEEILGDERARDVRLGDGASVSGEVVVVTAGVRPNSYLARQAGLEVNKGIVVDNHLTTSHPDVFAAGDVAEHQGVLYGTWSPAQYQGTIAGINAAGLATAFGGIPRSNMLKVLGIDLFSIGTFAPDDASYDVVCAQDDDKYYRFVFRDGQLRGAVFLGDTRLAATAKKAVENRWDCSAPLRSGANVTDVLVFLEKHPS
ncbi:MAG TPA: FAD-dependent oxidoreductase [Candidatus Hydrogenedentes bacterium]|nr:FAD-dependent oxidoreductase [Candidatus Hydrogenedentota bacterium]